MKSDRKALVICAGLGLFLTACAGQNPETAQSFAQSMPNLAERAGNPPGFWRGVLAWGLAWAIDRKSVV